MKKKIITLEVETDISNKLLKDKKEWDRLCEHYRAGGSIEVSQVHVQAVQPAE